LGNGLLACYLIDEGERATYVQNRHLPEAQIALDELHELAIENLAKKCKGNLQLHEFVHVFALTLGGTFEASLLLVDAVWDKWIRDSVENGFLAVIPDKATLVLYFPQSFCGSNYSVAVSMLR